MINLDPANDARTYTYHHHEHHRNDTNHNNTNTNTNTNTDTVSDTVSESDRRPSQTQRHKPGYVDPTACAVDIRSLITLEDVQVDLGLGPNGAILYCVEYLLANDDWLLDAVR